MKLTVLALVVNIISVIFSIITESWLQVGVNGLICFLLIWWLWKERASFIRETDKQLYNGENQQG